MNKINNIRKTRVTVNHYSLVIEGLPSRNVTAKQVEEFFSQFGNVQKVDFAYKYNNTLWLIKDIIKQKKTLKRLVENPKLKKERQKKKAKKKV